MVGSGDCTPCPNCGWSSDTYYSVRIPWQTWSTIASSTVYYDPPVTSEGYRWIHGAYVPLSEWLIRHTRAVIASWLSPRSLLPKTFLGVISRRYVLKQPRWSSLRWRSTT